MEQIHLIVSGRVQGVWYRASTRQRAAALGLVGWVRNLPDGRVEVVAEGPREDLDALVTWSREGPELAEVTGIDVEWRAASGRWSDFDIEPTPRR